MYYDVNREKKYTESQIKRRGLLKSGIDLEKIGIFPLSVEEPEGYDLEINTLSVVGYSKDGENGYQTDYELVFKELSVVQAVLFARLAEIRYNKEIGGTVWGGHPVDTDRESQPKVTAEYVAAVNGLRVDGEYWKMRDDTCVALTNAEAIEMASAVRAHVAACYTREAEIKALLIACETSAEVHAVFLTEVETGWPDTVAE